jgi:arylsulfatase
MIARWYEEAERYGVLPLSSPRGRASARPGGQRSPKHVELLPGAAPLTFTMAPRFVGRSHSITAEVTIPPEGAEGVLVTQGGRHVGFAFYLRDGRLHHVLNYVGLEMFGVSSPDPVPTGRQELRYEFERTGDPIDLLQGRGVPGRSKLYVGGTLVAVAEVPYSLVGSAGFYGMTCGYAHADSVVPDAFRPPFRFTGEIGRAVVDTGAGVTVDDDAELRALLAHQ